MRIAAHFLGLAVALFVVGGCGDTTCDTYGKTVCDLACDCTEGDRCVVTNAAGEVAKVYANKAECMDNYVGGGGCDPFFDFAGCLDAVEGASCTSVEIEDTGEMVQALQHPACNPDAGSE